MQRCFINAIQKLGKAKGRQAQGKRRGGDRGQPVAHRMPFSPTRRNNSACATRGLIASLRRLQNPAKAQWLGMMATLWQRYGICARSPREIERDAYRPLHLPAPFGRPLRQPGFFHDPQEGIDYPPGFL
jgi:hypothetical protein